jgi:hypothetical protein
MDYRREEQQQAIDTVESIAKFTNRMGFSTESFIVTMAREHRTLQQSFTGICLSWLWHLSQLEENYYDLRNEASVKIAKELLKGKDKYVACLPHI